MAIKREDRHYSLRFQDFGLLLIPSIQTESDKKSVLVFCPLELEQFTKCHETQGTDTCSFQKRSLLTHTVLLLPFEFILNSNCRQTSCLEKQTGAQHRFCVRYGYKWGQ